MRDLCWSCPGTKDAGDLLRPFREQPNKLFQALKELNKMGRYAGDVGTVGALNEQITGRKCGRYHSGAGSNAGEKGLRRYCGGDRMPDRIKS